MDSKPGNAEVTRRKFLGYLIGGISGLIGVIVAVPVIGYFLSPIWRKQSRMFTLIASVSDIPVDQPTFVTYEERIRDGWYITTLSKGAWVVNKDGKELIVFDPRCTHLNCPYYWDKKIQIFQCPCHDGEFDISGDVIGGPPPRPLDRLEFVVENGDILVSDRIIRTKGD